jgi:histidinol-phosphate aminotransferase
MNSIFYELARPSLRSLTAYQPGKSIAEVQREFSLSEIIKLASNENPFGMSPNVLEALQQLNSISRYPDPTGYALKQALAKYLVKAPENILLSNGSAEALSLIIQAFISQGDEVILSQYAYQLFEIISRAAGALCKIVPAIAWSHDLTAMANAITAKTKIIFIANPNNPTGTWVTSKQLSSFLDNVPNTVLVVVDEAYYEYACNIEYPDTLNLQRKHQNLIITRTFSKAYGLAGLRIGYAIAEKEIVEILNQIRLTFNINSAALTAAIAALDDQQHVLNCIQYTRQEKLKLEDKLTDCKLDYIPTATNFITIDFRKPILPIFNQLLRNGIITRPLANYQMPCHLRVTIGTPEENMKFIASINELMINE